MKFELRWPNCYTNLPLQQKCNAIWSRRITLETSEAVARARSRGEEYTDSNRTPRDLRNTARALACLSPLAVSGASGDLPEIRSGRSAASLSPWLINTTSTKFWLAIVGLWELLGTLNRGGGEMMWHGSHTRILGTRGVPALEGWGERGDAAARQRRISGSCSRSFEGGIEAGRVIGMGDAWRERWLSTSPSQSGSEWDETVDPIRQWEEKKERDGVGRTLAVDVVVWVRSKRGETKKF
jgi:hypothetical protein